MNHSVNSISVLNSFAYLATTDNSGELTILNISTPSAISVSGRYDLPSSNNDAEEVYVLDNHTYIGLNKGSSGSSEFLIIDTTSKTNPTLKRGISLGLKNNTKVTGIDVRGNYAFIATDVSNEEFRVLNITNPNNPVVMPCSPYNYSAKVSALQYWDNKIFLANQANDALRVIYDTNGNSCN